MNISSYMNNANKYIFPQKPIPKVAMHSGILVQNLNLVKIRSA